MELEYTFFFFSVKTEIRTKLDFTVEVKKNFKIAKNLRTKILTKTTIFDVFDFQNYF